ncbi:MAG TPA: hypothetical protein VIG57_15705, partial [Candidatus Entotheonella sp.]
MHVVYSLEKSTHDEKVCLETVMPPYRCRYDTPYQGASIAYLDRCKTSNIDKLNLYTFFQDNNLLILKGLILCLMRMYDFLLTVLGRRCTMAPLENIKMALRL